MISVIMPVYNGSRFIRESIESVLSEDISLELIIIDDGSVDETCSVIRSILDDRIRYSYQNNQGVAAALNAGLSLAKGQYIAYLDADDVNMEGRLRNQKRILDQNPSVGLVLSNVTYIDELGNRLHDSNLNSPDLVSLLYYNGVPHSSVMHRRELLSVLGGFSAEGRNQDWEFYVRAIEKTEFFIQSDPQVKYRINPSGIHFHHSRKFNKFRRDRFYINYWAFKRRNFSFLLGASVIRAFLEWTLLSPPLYSERSFRIWWPLHRALNALEIFIWRGALFLFKCPKGQKAKILK